MSFNCLITKYKLPLYLGLFFNWNANYLYIYNEGRVFFLRLPSFYFFKRSVNTYSFLFVDKYRYITFFKHMVTMSDKLISYYFARLKLRGLGYRVQILTSNLIRLFFNRSNYYYIHIPKSIMVKYRTRRLIFLGICKPSMTLFLMDILWLNTLSVYRLRGLFHPNKIILMKPGKARFRY